MRSSPRGWDAAGASGAGTGDAPAVRAGTGEKLRIGFWFLLVCYYWFDVTHTELSEVFGSEATAGALLEEFDLSRWALRIYSDAARGLLGTSGEGWFVRRAAYAALAAGAHVEAGQHFSRLGWYKQAGQAYLEAARHEKA